LVPLSPIEEALRALDAVRDLLSHLTRLEAQSDGRAAALLTSHELADRWGCSLRTVQKRIAEKALPTVALGPRLTRVRIEDVEAYEAALGAAPAGLSARLPGSLTTPVLPLRSGATAARPMDFRVRQAA
jgi:excisionase family DNA binding protein